MSVRKYPKVVGEFATVEKLVQGFSIGRFGDGELKMATGSGYVREAPSKRMAAELMELLHAPYPTCLVGIWTMDPKGPKFRNMMRHYKRFKSVLSPEVQYHSSLITRPDSAPWIRTREYARLVQKIWAGKRVAVVCEHKGSIARTVKLSARKMTHIVCPHEGAYDVIDALEVQIIAYRPEVAVISAGPTATCLAHRLAKRGIQAIDFGSGGKFIQELL